MKKKNLLFLPLLALIAYSCHKELSLTNANNVASKLTISQAKSYLDSSLKTTSADVKIQSIDSSVKNIDGYLFWDKAKELEGRKFSIVEIPFNIKNKRIALYNFPADHLSIDPDASVASAAFSRILIFRSQQTQTIEKKIITYIADRRFLIEHHGDASQNWITNLDKKFCGYIEYKNWNGAVEQVFRILDGQVVKAYNIAKIAGPSKTQVESIKTNGVGCSESYVPYYVQGCSGDGEGNAYNCGALRYDGGYWATSCTGSTGGSPGSGGSPSPGQGGSSGGGASNGSSYPGLSQNSLETLDQQFQINNDVALIRCDSLQLLKIQAYQNYGRMFQDVAQYVGPLTVGQRVNALGLQENWPDSFFDQFNITSLFGAYGAVVNCDFFPVRITQLPPGMTMASLTEYFRLNMTNFISPSLNTSFSPYVDNYTNDTNLFNSPGAQSLGALVHIHMKDNGTVIESGYDNTDSHASFKFSTMDSPLDNDHPVAGTREFGVYQDPNRPGEYTFYTMGVDRTSDWLFSAFNYNGAVFAGADQLWSDMQNNMIAFINLRGGSAGYYNQKSYIARPDFALVKNFLQGNQTYQQLLHQIGCD